MVGAGSVAVRIAQTSSAQAWSDPTALTENVAKTAAWYDEAADAVDLVVFPELNLSGYIPLKGYDQTRKRTLYEVAQRATGEELPRLAALTEGRRAAMVVGFMEASTMRNEMHNSLALLQDGQVLGIYRKMHLPVEENHYFLPGDAPLVLDTRAGRVALSICYDMVFPESARLAALAGAEVLLVCSNWLGIANLRQLGAVLPVARALEQQVHVVFVNGVGELEVRGRRWELFGTSTIVSATGRILATAGEAEERLDGLLTADDLAEAAGVFPVLRDRRPGAYGDLVALPSAFSTYRPAQAL
ncbi:MAG: carbon-nitrogen hydrolase family protein [Acidimicrobiales bacterium]|nr:carbon-nitrogen hydrolase family protein [Acidimicrobiales bacterium]